MSKETLCNHIEYFTDEKFVRFITGRQINNGCLMSSMVVMTFPQLIEAIADLVNNEHMIFIDALYSNEMPQEVTILLERE